MGRRSGLWWPLRARNLDGRSAAAGIGVPADPAGPRLLGRAAATTDHLRGPPDPALSRRSSGRRRPRLRTQGCGQPKRHGGWTEPCGRHPAGQPSAVSQAGGPRPHGSTQDQQRARPGAPDAAPWQDPRDRRDRRRPARRGDRDGVRVAGAALRRLHGRRGHRAAEAQRATHVRARRRGPASDIRLGHPEGRHQRGDARLGDERRDHALRPGIGNGTAPVSDPRPRSAAGHRR